MCVGLLRVQVGETVKSPVLDKDDDKLTRSLARLRVNKMPQAGVSV